MRLLTIYAFIAIATVSVDCAFQRRFARHSITFTRVSTPEERGEQGRGRYLCIKDQNCTHNSKTLIVCRSDSRWNWDCFTDFNGSYTFAETEITCDPASNAQLFDPSTCWLEYTIRPQTPTEENDQYYRDHTFPLIFAGLVGAFVMYIVLSEGRNNPRDEKIVERPIAVAQRVRGEDSTTEEEKKACVVCLLNVKVCAVLPCGHVSLCIKCSNEYEGTTCPICREKIKDYVRIFK
jgi:hypothetical protein